MKSLSLFLMFACLLPRATAQIQSGTIVVFHATNKKLVIATDSRITRDSGKVTTDDGCKIWAFQSKFAFVSVGTSSFGHGAITWDSTDSAREAIRIANPLTPDRHSLLKQIADSWGEISEHRWSSLYLRHPEDVYAARKTLGKDVLSRGLFATADPDRDVFWLIMRAIMFNPSDKHPVRAVATPILEECATTFCALGNVDIFNEFMSLSSERARQEARTWRPSTAQLSKLDRFLRTEASTGCNATTIVQKIRTSSRNTLFKTAPADSKSFSPLLRYH
jgi:hypothetical protein